MEKGFGFSINFSPDKGFGGGKTEDEKKNKHFEELMGPEVVKMRDTFKKREIAKRRKLTDDEKTELLEEAGYIERFMEALDKENIDVDTPEGMKKADELTRWCLMVSPDEEKKKEPANNDKRSIMTQADLDTELEKINLITSDEPKIARLKNLAKRLYDEGNIDKGNLISAEIVRMRSSKSEEQVEGLPDDKSERGWRQWTRARMSALLDPSAGSEKNAGNVFSVISNSGFEGGRFRHSVPDGSVYMPRNLREEIVEGVRRPDGRLERSSELQVTQEIARIYEGWRKAHRKLPMMVSSIENGEYRLPDNQLHRRLLNELKSEDGTDPEGGSKLVSKAIQIYWAMAHSNEVEAKEILRDNGLMEGDRLKIKNLFNTPLTSEEIGETRGMIADACGGTFYENLGLIYASFLGISAYGSDSTASGIAYMDEMGLLVHSEQNRFQGDNERYNATKRSKRFLDDVVANHFYVVNGGNVVTGADGKPVPIELSTHSGTLQEMVEVKGEPRGFYVIRERGSNEKYRLVKKISKPDGEGVIHGRLVRGTNDTYELDTDRFEEVLFEDLIKEGRLNEIDWGNSVELTPIITTREKGAINVYKMFKNLDDDFSKLSKGALVGKWDTVSDATPQYTREVQQRLIYLWLYSLMERNKQSLLSAERKDMALKVLREAHELGYITKKQVDDVKKKFNINPLSDFATLFDGKTFTPKSMFESFSGKKDK